MSPKFLIAGHIVKDVTKDGWRPGGGVLYAAAQASKLGLEVAVMTACAEDIDPPSLLPDVAWMVQASEVTTTFENSYQDGRRRQRLLARGRQLDFAALPEGWLRELDGSRVRAAGFETSPAYLGGEVVFVSDEDVQEAESVAVWREHVPVVALTRGRGGCTVWDTAGRHDISASEAREEDPTGAGDVFAAAFLVRLEETRDAVGAARFATAAGTLSVRGGFESVASREEIEALLEQGRVKVA